MNRLSVEILFPTILLAATATYGVASLSAVGRHANWFWRVAPLVLLVVALVPIGTNDLLVLFGAEAGTIVGLVWVTRLLAALLARRRARVPGDPQSTTEAPPASLWQLLRFGLLDLLKLILLCAVVAAIISYAPSNFWMGSSEWHRVGFAGAQLGLIALAGGYCVAGSARWYLRCAAGAVIIVGAGLLIAGGFFLSLLSFASAEQLAPVWCLVFAGAEFTLIATWLFLLRQTGWAWWSHSVRGSAAVIPATERSRVWPRGIPIAAGGLLVGLTILVLAPLVELYAALLPSRTIPVITLPEPNGYDELVAASQAMNWMAIPGDIETASIAECEQFVRDNAEPLRRLQEALGKPCQVPLDFSSANGNFQQNGYQHLRKLGRALGACRKAEEGNGNWTAALECDLWALQVSDATSRGGLLLDEVMGGAIEFGAIDSVVDKLDHLDGESLARLQRGLATRLNERQPIDEVLARSGLADHIDFRWVGRLSRWLEAQSGFEQQVLTDVRRLNDTRLQLLITECALLRYRLAQGTPPDALDQLVPELLSQLPRDPYGDGPLKYRRTGDGWLLYSVGKNGVDDGGKRVSLTAATSDGKGDVFYDADPNARN